MEKKITQTFSYQNGEVTLNFSLTTNEDKKAFLEMLHQAIEDVTKSITE